MLLQPSHLRNERRRPGFTLTELLVVIAIIVLVVTLAVPAFNVITGNRSIDSAQNQLAAIIGRARQEALGLQDFRGVILFTDPNTSRICAAEVYYPTPGSNVLGLAPSHDELLLPNGISFRTIEDGGGSSTMNVLMFNGQGQFVSQSWSLPIGSDTQVSMQTPPKDPTARLSWRIQPNPFGATPISSGNSAFGFLLFPDEAAYQNAYTANPNTTYLSDNGVAFMINRYSGTLLRTE